MRADRVEQLDLRCAGEQPVARLRHLDHRRPVEVGTLPQAPDPKKFVTDEYLKMVAADPKLKAFATEFDKKTN